MGGPGENSAHLFQVMDDLDSITAALDARHSRSRAAFERRDLEAYRAIFAPGLRYRQLDGRVIDRDRLIKDVGVQFRALAWIRSDFTRESIKLDGERVIEVLTQRAQLGTSAFLVVHRTWELHRRGRYTWIRQGDEWLIEAVEVLEESVTGRLAVGLHHPLAPWLR